MVSRAINSMISTHDYQLRQLLAGIPVEENPLCDALRDAKDKAGSEEAKAAIQEALDKFVCGFDPCPGNSSVPATLGNPCTQE